MPHLFDVDNDLCHRLAKLYQKTFNLSPLSAKMYAFLIFDFQGERLSFEDFVEVFSVSKSSVSTSINLLLDKKLVVDFYKDDKRKRFFKINCDFVKIRFMEIMSRLKEEREVLISLIDFSKNKNPDISGKIGIHKVLLDENISNIEQTIVNL